MGHETVLCHTFEHDGRWFCFDTATSHIYECDEVSADLAPVWNKVTDGPERQAADRKSGRERVQAALEEIRELNAAEQALAPRDLTIVHECGLLQRFRSLRVRHRAPADDSHRAVQSPL